MGDVDVDRARLAQEIKAPYQVEQLLAGEHPPLVFGQRVQQVERLGAQSGWSTRDRDLAPRGVDGDVAGMLSARLVRARAGWAAAAQDGLDARHQLAWVEGLGEVVVGAQLEADDLVDV